MRIRTLRDVSPAHRKPVQVWYAAGIVRLSDDAMGRTGLRFGPRSLMISPPPRARTPKRTYPDGAYSARG